MHEPERLALDVLYDGIAAGAAAGDGDLTTARAANYVSVVGLTEGSKIDGSARKENSSVRLWDEVSGEEFSLSARLIINTSGPWTDLTNAALGRPTKYMGGTKGSHIVLDNPELLAATAEREIFFEHSDGRVVLIYPLKGRVLVGTTDIDADPSEQPVCTDDEVAYFFELIGHVFPGVSVDRSQIVYTFSGIRPLPRHDDTVPGFVSRDYRIEHGTVGGVALLSLVGGKWTTFRALAEHLGDTALQIVRVPRTSSTRNTAIGGGAGFPKGKAARKIWISRNASGHSRELVELMLNRYGTRASELLAALPHSPQELIGAPGHFAEELEYLASQEDVVHLDDVILRRTSLAFLGGLTSDTLSEVAAAIAPTLGWNAAAQKREVDRMAQILHDVHRIELNTPGLSPTDTMDGALHVSV